MDDGHFFADVDLPFHVWVREKRAGESRWVLRHASELPRGARAASGGAAGDAPTGRRPAGPR